MQRILGRGSHLRWTSLVGAVVLAAALASILGSTVLAGRGEAEKGAGRTTGQAKNVIF